MPVRNFVSDSGNLNSYFGVPDGPSFGVYLRDIGFHKTSPCHNFGPAVRDYWLIHVIKSGKGWFMKSGVKTTLSAGDCFIIRPMEVTTYCSDETDPWQYYWLGFQGEYAAKLAAYALPDNISYAKVGGETLNSLESLYRKFSLRNGGDPLEFNAGMFDFLAKLKNSVSPVQKSAPDVVDEAVKYIENNFFRAVSITAIADMLGVTRTYFTTNFTQKKGVSPYAYLTDYRIKKAKSLLLDSDLRISEIAYSVGFSGVERFSDMFRRHVGVSPTEYRLKKQDE